MSCSAMSHSTYCFHRPRKHSAEVQLCSLEGYSLEWLEGRRRAVAEAQKALRLPCAQASADLKESVNPGVLGAPTRQLGTASAIIALLIEDDRLRYSAVSQTQCARRCRNP